MITNKLRIVLSVGGFAAAVIGAALVNLYVWPLRQPVVALFLIGFIGAFLAWWLTMPKGPKPGMTEYRLRDLREYNRQTGRKNQAMDEPRSRMRRNLMEKVRTIGKEKQDKKKRYEPKFDV